MARQARLFYRSVVFYLFMFIIFCCSGNKPSKLMSKSLGLDMQSLAVSGNVSAVHNLKFKVVKLKPSTTMAVPLGLKVSRSLRLFKLCYTTSSSLWRYNVKPWPAKQ